VTEGGSFYGTPAARGGRDRRAVVTVILVLALIALAIAKPWGDSGRHTASTEPRLAAASPSASSAIAIASPRPGAGVPAGLPHPLPVAFTAPLPGAAAWATLVWRRLAPDDPLTSLRTEVTARGRSVAIGDIAGTTSTTVWSSTDATHWQPLPSATSTSFWSNITIIALATLRGRFVAVSEMNDFLMQHLPPVVAWTSTDGQSWVPANTLPVDAVSSPSASTALVAAGQQALVIATSGLGARLATSIDGSHWVLLPRNAFPADFALNDLEATPTGFVAIGGWMKDASAGRPAALWSADGRHWPKTPTLLPTVAPASGTPVVSNAVTLTVGDQGMIASGIGGSPGATRWWRSPDGRHWQALPTFPAPEASMCRGADCGLQPTWTIVGDGHRIVAWNGGASATALVSTDGKQWAALRLSGDIPDAQATRATLLPGGILLSDATTTWFGKAEGQ
jgi:hypothetical protein